MAMYRVANISNARTRLFVEGFGPIIKGRPAQIATGVRLITALKATEGLTVQAF